ncbi:hypothetical protein OUZ56_007492 [Daphnia magna]|uniref:Uncharacterized protein n=1 Tax=Daphnia magna TaxID=35525 RepID=A0ABR0AA42_9CRUS|nr:hypothetical protein OUZ56_007492 [Daphnia magna]
MAQFRSSVETKELTCIISAHISNGGKWAFSCLRGRFFVDTFASLGASFPSVKNEMTSLGHRHLLLKLVRGRGDPASGLQV